MMYKVTNLFEMKEKLLTSLCWLIVQIIKEYNIKLFRKVFFIFLEAEFMSRNNLFNKNLFTRILSAFLTLTHSKRKNNILYNYQVKCKI